MQAPQFDAIEFKKLDLPYSKFESELSEEPRIVRGYNTYVTPGGKLCKRPGTLDTTSGLSLNRRIDRLEYIETVSTPSVVFLLASAYNYSTSKWEVWYLRLTAGVPAWTKIPDFRSVNSSTAPHEWVIVRGMAYIFAFPAGADPEKQASVIFDPSTDTTTPRTIPWGIGAPTQAAKVGSNTSIILSANIDETATSIPVSTVAGLPALPFVASIGSEQINVTGKSSPTATLGLAEVQVYGWDPATLSNANLANAYGTATQSTTSTTATWATADKAKDGNTDGQLNNGHVSLTQAEANPWWQVDLAGNYTIGGINVYNRTDTGASDLTDYWIFVSSNPFLAGDTPTTLSVRANTLAYHDTGSPNPMKSVYLTQFIHGSTAWSPSFQGRYVRVQLSGGTYVTATRGYNNSAAAPHTKGDTLSSQAWTASSYPVSVKYGWRYKYAYKTQSGHIGPASTNDDTPGTSNSNTNAFTSKIPQITYKDSAANSGITDIVFYRTLDGGGQWLKLGSVAATGTGGTLTYTDNTGPSGDPLSDLKLDTSDVAAGTTQNNPPPRAIAPKVTGTDTPMDSTAFAYYQGRVWYGIGNILVFSGNEEVSTGVPEESFFTGITGGFMRFQFPITRVMATTQGLYIFTSQSVHKLTGNNRETFNASPLFDSVGAAPGHKRAAEQFLDNIVFLTHDYRIGLITNDQFRSLSDPLGSDIIDAVNAGAELEIKYWADMTNEWIVVAAVYASDQTKCRQWVFDVKKSQALQKDFWNTPWQIPSTCMLSARVREDQSQRRLVFAMWDFASKTTKLAHIDPTGATATDYTPTGTVGYGLNFVTSLMKNPTGNHLNTLRAPVQTTVLQWVQLERSVFEGDADPFFAFYVDDTWSTPIEAIGPPEDPYRREVSRGYKTMLWSFNRACQRAAVEVLKLANAERFELQTLTLALTPDSGS